MERVTFDQVVSRGCGLDVHKKVVVATATIDGDGINKTTREFSTFTSSLTELRDWLLEFGITHVAMESTGVYRKPVYYILEPTGMNVWIVNVHAISNTFRLISPIKRIVPGSANFFWQVCLSRAIFLAVSNGSFVI